MTDEDANTSGNDLNVCHLSAGDLEMIVEGKTVGPWLFDGTVVFVDIDKWEREKIRSLETDTEQHQ